MVVDLVVQSNMEYHDVANIFPMMGDEEYSALVDDIKANGLLESIWTYQGKIIDGRNRYKACLEIGIEPSYREWDGKGSLVEFVVSLNLKRRHLTSSQKAMVALEVESHLAKEAQKRMLAGKAPDPGTILSQGGRSAHQAGAIVGASGTYVKDAKRIAEKAPELVHAVLSGKMNILDAKAISKLSDKQRAAAIDKIESGKKPKAAVLDIKKAERDAQAQAAPSKPLVTLASWENWLPEQSECDLLITDPPYATDIDDITSFAQSWLPLALSKVKKTGRAYVCIGAYPQEIQAYLSVQASMAVQQILVWSYKNTIGPSPLYGYKQNWQAILYFVGESAPPLNCPLMNEQFSVQEINAPDGRLGDRYHTWQKPDKLAEQLIRHSTKQGDRVIDCFAGTGTFLLAAHRLGREAFGCEYSEDMIQIAEQRGCEVSR